MSPLDWRNLRDSLGGREVPDDLDERMALKRATLRSPPGAGMLVAVLYVALLLLGLVYYASYSGSLRWVLAFLLAAGFGVAAMRLVHQGTRDPDAASGGAGSPAPRPGEVRRFAAVLERAAHGMKYSQIVADERLREALVHRARLQRAAIETSDTLQRDPAALRHLLGDEELVRFVVRSEESSRIWPGMIDRMPRRPAFWGEFRSILAKAVTWK